jgi:hypothetical protein
MCTNDLISMIVRNPLSLIIASAFSINATDLSTYPLKAIFLPNANLLSKTFIKRHPQASIDKLLARAKSAGYTHLIVNFEIQVFSEGTKVSGDEFVFYPFARFKEDWPDGAYHQYKEAFEKAASMGFILIPHIEMATSRCSRKTNPGSGWDDLHPAMVNGKPCDSDGRASTIILNQYGGRGSTPFADDGHQGFAEHLHELYATIKKEYEAADPRPASLPFINLSFDENEAAALDPKTGSMWFTQVRNKQYLNPVLLLGQTNPFDQTFLQKCIDREVFRGRPLATAVKIAISTLYVYRIEQELAAVEKTFGPSTGLMIGGYMFDPQTGGGESYFSAYNPTSKFVPQPGTKGPDIMHNVRVALALKDGYDVLDLPGASNPDVIRKNTILIPWWYFTYRRVLSNGLQPDYDPSISFAYFTSKGFRFAFMSTLTSFENETSPRAATVDIMQKSLNALGSKAYSGKAYGFVAAWWPCFSHRHGEAGTHALGDSSCRCGAFNINLHWHNDKDAYDQPFEYNTLEYMMWYAQGKTNRPPVPGSKNSTLKSK